MIGNAFEEVFPRGGNSVIFFQFVRQFHALVYHGKELTSE